MSLPPTGLVSSRLGELRDPVAGAVGPGHERSRLRENLHQPCRDLVLLTAGVTVTRQPPHVRQQHRLRRPHPLKAPPGLGAGPARHLERFGIARCDAVVGADVDDHGRAIRAAHEEVRGMPTLTRPVVPVQPERLGGDTHHSRIEIHEHETVPLQPRLEADMLPRRRRPVPAREIAPSWRPPKRPYRTSILEPDRHTVQQRTPQTLALAHHTRHLGVRRRPFRTSRYRHTTPPACSPLTTRFPTLFCGTW